MSKQNLIDKIWNLRIWEIKACNRKTKSTDKGKNCVNESKLGKLKETKWPKPWKTKKYDWTIEFLDLRNWEK